jgi:plasmid stabilization system protein ParE
MSGFVFHPDAITDLVEIWEFIAADNPDDADRVLQEIETALHALVTFPQQGHSRRDLTSRPLKFHIVREFLIAYTPSDQPLLVIAVLHGRRNPRILASQLRDRK